MVAATKIAARAGDLPQCIEAVHAADRVARDVRPEDGRAVTVTDSIVFGCDS